MRDQNYFTTSVRLRKELHEQLLALAQREHRSLNSQIIVAIEAHLRNQQKAKEQ